MYVPSTFEETRIDVLHQLARKHSLAALVTLEPDGLNANHVPLLLDPEPAPFGTLRGHIARANPLWRNYSREMDALAIFQGPQAYITPSWYATKRETGKVVPTYNYMVVHAYGRLRIIEDRKWLRELLERLTGRHEAGRPAPWRVADAPESYIETLLKEIIGIEIPISRLIGKWKISQNRSPADRQGVAAGLSEAEDTSARAMAASLKGGA